MQLFSVVFCMVRAVHKFDFRLVINETYNKWRQVDSSSCGDTRFMFLTGFICFHLTVVASVKEIYPRFAGVGGLNLQNCVQELVMLGLQIMRPEMRLNGNMDVCSIGL